jgi:hypothetical protein
MEMQTFYEKLFILNTAGTGDQLLINAVLVNVKYYFTSTRLHRSYPDRCRAL